ncbi:MAG: lytic transglycosylase domain-containing protein [Parasphingorhabdus sp.]|nr:lytic transglycosylase domain-containing protein [Parasphingorhabdus sp.]
MISTIWTVIAALSVLPGAAVAAEAESFPTTEIHDAKNDDRAESQYRAVFSAIEAADWAKAQQLLSDAPPSPLKPIATAELYLAAGSPKVELGPLLTLINDAPDIPQAEQLSRLAQKRGAQLLPALPQRNRLSYVAGNGNRAKPASVADSGIRAQIIAQIKADNPHGAEALLNANMASLSPDAQTELQQRIAWSYYIENDDPSALRLAQVAQAGVGEWVGHADWVAGLAAWRLKDCNRAGDAFDRSARNAGDDEMRGASYYWSARASIACAKPDKAQAKLQAAARYDDSFYGVLAAETLGMDVQRLNQQAALSKKDWRALKDNRNVQATVALVAIGQNDLADEVLRYQARIGADSDHTALLSLAKQLGLPRAQLFLAHYAPAGVKPDVSARFPAPNWTPDGGWRIDPSLIFAHTLQESAFQTRVVSAADARGLMQVRPIAAADIARHRGMSFTSAQLFRPSTNLEYGQSYLEMLRDMSATGGLLPKVVAAYNAGPSPVQRWNTEIRDNGDPLLFIESIPYVETRAYVAIILRNYWIYSQQAGHIAPSLTQIAGNAWPRLPTAKDVSRAVVASR